MEVNIILIRCLRTWEFVLTHQFSKDFSLFHQIDLLIHSFHKLFDKEKLAIGYGLVQFSLSPL